MICTREGCGHAAEVAPKVCVPARGRPVGDRQTIEAVLRLPMCWACMGKAKAADFLNIGDPAGRALIARVGIQAAGRFLPDIPRAVLQTVDLTSRAFKILDQAGPR